MDIEQLRARIDRVDREIVALLNERVGVAREIGRVKAGSGAAVYAPDREAMIHRRLAEMNPGPLADSALRAVYTEIISACRASEKRLRIAFLGPEGTFTHQAVLRKFGSGFDSAPVRTITQVFEDVEAGRADYGVVPTENTLEGAVNDALNGLMDFDVRICAEVYLEVHHSLMARNADGPVDRVYSKAEALAQCRGYLAAHLPAAELVAVASTAEAAARAAREDGAAAIAHAGMAQRLDLVVLKDAIEDRAFNMTRFLVLSREVTPPTGHDKTSILCFIHDEVGALTRLLGPLEEMRVNLTRIESRPSRRRAWDYCFFIDVLGHCEDENIRLALGRVGERCTELKLLGSYPAENDSPSAEGTGNKETK